jgi:Iap family predicted aminopeptidase
MNTEKRSAEFQAAERAMLGDIWTSTTLWPTMRALCDDFGGRFAGSAQERAAAAWLVRALKQYGLRDVHTESFPLHAWRRGPAQLKVSGHVLDCIGLPGTPACRLSAPIVFIGDGEPADFARVGERAKGALALVLGAGSHRLEKYFRAVEAGCVGFLFAGGHPGALPPTGSIEFGGAVAPIPGVGVSFETAQRLRRMCESAESLTASLTVQAKSTLGKGLNVIGDVTAAGPNKIDGCVMLCAHFDGHDIAQGAVDNASGVAAVLEAARALMAVREQLNLDVRVALWSGEEIGMLGSAAYAAAHRDELSQVRFVFNADIVGNPGAIWLGVNGHDVDRTTAVFRALAEACVHDLRITGNETIVPYSDHFSFYLHGVPALMMAVGDAPLPHAGPHTWGDTLDKVDARGLRHSAAFAARAVLHLAHEPSVLPKRRATPAEVQRALEKAGYAALLKMQGRWPF